MTNNATVSTYSIGILLENKQLSKIFASYVGDSEVFFRKYMEGSIEVEIIPQGTLAEKMRSGGAGIPAFFT